MTALARRRIAPAVMPEPEPTPVPEKAAPKWSRLAKPIFPADNVAHAFWLSRCPDELRRNFQLTDLRGLARAIRSN